MIFNKTGISLIAIAALLVISVASAERVIISEKLISIIRNKFGDPAVKRIRKWEMIIKNNKNLPDREKLELVNKFFNKLRWIEDIDLWGKSDYWATPVEMLAMRAGDCEDFSIAKYFTLIEMGIPQDKLLITYVRAEKLDQSHMVLSYYGNSNKEPLILDNMIKRIQPGSKRKDLLPIYSFNGEGLWLSKERARGKLLGPPDKLALWKDLTERMQTELQ